MIASGCPKPNLNINLYMKGPGGKTLDHVAIAPDSYNHKTLHYKKLPKGKYTFRVINWEDRDKTFDFVVGTSAGFKKVSVNNPYAKKPSTAPSSDSAKEMTKNGYKLTHSVSNQGNRKRVQA